MQIAATARGVALRPRAEVKRTVDWKGYNLKHGKEYIER
jgi:hypothetical protein